MNVHASARTTAFSRALLVRRVRSEGWRVTDAAAAAGVTERTAYKWLRRARTKQSLSDASSRPHRIQRRLCEQLLQLVERLRRQRMTAIEIARQLRVPRTTVARALQRLGLSRLRDLQPIEPVVRYEHARPGDLLHVDIKKLGRFVRVGHRITGSRAKQSNTRGAGWEFVHVAIDDHTRLAYVEVLDDERGPSAAGFLRRACAWFARLGVRVRRVLSDNGSCYRSDVFAEICDELRIRHSCTRPYRPQTNGKAERFIQTMLREWAYARSYPTSTERLTALQPWVRHYNRRRPHGSLGAQPPITRLRAA